MINLLPEQLKKDYTYARRNKVLRKYILISIIGSVGLMLIATFGLILYKNSWNNNQSQINSITNKLNSENISSTNTQITNFSDTFKLVTKVLSQEILFSKMITSIGAAMPTGTALTGLSINNTSTGINLTADASSYNTATQIQVNLSDPSKGLFKNVDIISINNSGSTGNNNLPYTVSLRALFNNTNQFLLINQKATK